MDWWERRPRAMSGLEQPRGREVLPVLPIDGRHGTEPSAKADETAVESEGERGAVEWRTVRGVTRREKTDGEADEREGQRRKENGREE